MSARKVVVVAGALLGIGIAGARLGRADDPASPSLINNAHQLAELGTFAQSPFVRQELKLTEGQVKELVLLDMEEKERAEDYLMRATHTGGEPEGRILRQSLFLTFRTDKELLQFRRDSVFQGSQLERIKQLASQHLTNDPKRGFGLLSYDVEKQLNLTSDQRNALKAKSAAMGERLLERERELRLELDKLRADMRKELIGTLDQTQQTTLQKLWGHIVPVPPSPGKH